jgi:tetratricopeptide (TPR) repeat protein
MKSCVLGVVFFVVLSVCSAKAQSDSAFDAITFRGIHNVYNLEFEKAEAEFRQLVVMRPHHPAGHFFLGMVTWWRIVIDLDNTEYDESFYDAMDRVVEMCDSILDTDPDNVTAIFFKGGAIGFKGRLKFHRDDYLAAANAGRKALPLVQMASELDPRNYDILLGTGMYNYYAEVIPSEYPWLKPLLLFVPSGDKKKGLEQLTTASEKGKYSSIETTYFLMQIYFFYEKDYPKALALAHRLHGQFEGNMLFHRYLGRCYASLTNWPETRRVFSQILDRVEKGQRGYTENAGREAEYYIALCDMNTRDYESALAHFFRCDSLSRSLDEKGPSGFMVMANLKAGNIYDIMGKRDLAVDQYNKVLSMKEYLDSHKQAVQYLKSAATY